MTDNPYGGSQPGYGQDPNAQPARQTQPSSSPPTGQPAQPGYGQPAQGYTQPVQGYAQPAQEYGQPTQGYGGYPYPPANGPAGEQAKGFLGSLFDFSFTSFVTPKIIKVVYVLEVVFTVLAYLIVTISSFATNGALGLVVLISGAIGAILYLALLRMVLEFFLGVYRISLDVHAIKGRQGL